METKKGVILFVWFTKLWQWVSNRKLDCTSFDEFLDHLEKLEELHHLTMAGAAKYQLQILKIELRFLKMFTKCIAGNSTLKECTIPVTSAIKLASWDLLLERENHTNFDAAVSNALEAIEENRMNIGYFYELASISSKSYVFMTNDLLVRFMNDLLKNLEDVPRYKVNLVITVKRQIDILKEELIFLRNFLCFAGNRCGEHKVFKRFAAHIEGVALDATCLSYSCLTNKVNDEKLSDLLKKIKPVKPEVREMYIHVLQASKPSQSSDVHVLEAFVQSLQDIMLEILNFGSCFKHLNQDQLKMLNHEFRFLGSLLMDLPRQYIDLFKYIETVAIKSRTLLFSLYVSEMNEESPKQVNLMLVDLLENMRYIKTEAREIFLKIPKPSNSKFPMTDGLGFIRFLVENLKDFLSNRHDSIDFIEHHIQTMQKDFEFLISLLEDMEERLQHEELKSIWTRVLDMAYHAEYIIDSFLIKDGHLWYHLSSLHDLLEEIQLIKAHVSQVHSTMSHEIGVSNISKPSSSELFLQAAHTPLIKERIVGFEDEADKVIELLINGPSTVLDTVSIVGMPGLGKTTLAKKVYNSVSVEKHFHVRAWCTVSPAYQKKDLLLSILSHIIVLKDEIRNMDTDDLAQVLYKSVKGRRYLMVMDDIWNIEAWHDFRRSFPDDKNGSRVLVTSRVLDVALQTKLYSYPLALRLLNHRECWELLLGLRPPTGHTKSTLV